MSDKFLIVARELSFKPFSKVDGCDKWGWRVVDGVEIADFKEAQRLMAQHQLAMPNHIVKIRPIRERSKS
jgi:hypothetical protein